MLFWRCFVVNELCFIFCMHLYHISCLFYYSSLFRFNICMTTGLSRMTYKKECEITCWKIIYSTSLRNFFGPYMRTFDDLGQVKFFLHFYELSWSFGKMAQTSPKWSTMAQNHQQFPKIDQIDPESPKMAQNGPNWSIWVILFHQLINSGPVGPFWTILGHCGPFWDILGHFSPASRELIKMERKIKPELNHQMSAYMVQENHEEKSNR